MPTISYTAGASTLKGQVEVEAALIQAFSVGGVNIPVAGTVFAGFANLGGDTTIVVNPDTSVRVKSAPQTDELWVSASVDSKYDRLEIDKDPLFEGAGFTGTLKGHIGVPTIHVGTLRLDLTGLRDLTLHPGANLSYLTVGIEGDYDNLAIDVGDVNIVPDVDLTLHISTPIPLPDLNQTLKYDQAIHGLRFHLADQQLRQAAAIPITDIAGCVKIDTVPGPTVTSVNHIDIKGSGGQQTLNYLDPDPPVAGLDPALIKLGLDLLTAYYTHPFTGNDVQYHPTVAGC